MILRNTSTGGLEVYDIANNQITNAAFMGTVGLDWKTSGFGNFSSNPGETDMLLRNSNTGGLEVYNISNNQITGAAFLGTVGLDWQFAGVAPVHGPGASDLVLRNINSGQFEVYNIANNQITGAAPLGSVGLDWQVGGLAVDPPSASTASLVQAMASFGGGSGTGESLNTAPLGAETGRARLSTTSPRMTATKFCFGTLAICNRYVSATMKAPRSSSSIAGSITRSASMDSRLIPDTRGSPVDYPADQVS
jgi:hypothetical protein